MSRWRADIFIPRLDFGLPSRPDTRGTGQRGSERRDESTLSLTRFQIYRLYATRCAYKIHVHEHIHFVSPQAVHPCKEFNKASLKLYFFLAAVESSSIFCYWVDIA